MNSWRSYFYFHIHFCKCNIHTILPTSVGLIRLAPINKCEHMLMYIHIRTVFKCKVNWLLPGWFSSAEFLKSLCSVTLVKYFHVPNIFITPSLSIFYTYPTCSQKKYVHQQQTQTTHPHTHTHSKTHAQTHTLNTNLWVLLVSSNSCWSTVTNA